MPHEYPHHPRGPVSDTRAASSVGRPWATGLVVVLAAVLAGGFWAATPAAAETVASTPTATATPEPSDTATAEPGSPATAGPGAPATPERSELSAPAPTATAEPDPLSELAPGESATATPEPTEPGESARPTPEPTTPAPTPTPDPTTPAPEPTIDTLSIDTANGETFQPRAAVRLEGAKESGAAVRVTLDGRELCVTEADDARTWSCTVELPNGAATLVAEELVDGAVDDEVDLALRVLGPPTIDGTDGVTSSGLVTGIAMPGATIAVRVTGPVSFTQRCPVALGSGTWSCALAADQNGDGTPDPLPSGTYSVRATQGSGAEGEVSDASGARTVAIDRDRPETPVVTSPRAGSEIADVLEVRGTGESGAAAQVWIDGRTGCEVPVVDGTFTCRIHGIPDGEHAVQVSQRDAAGNYSALSGAIDVVVGASGTTTPPPSSGTPTQPAPEQGDDGTAAPTTPQDPGPGSAPALPDAAPPSTGGAPDAWGEHTDYGLAVPTRLAALADDGGHGWPAAFGIALLFVGLVALPLRLLGDVLLPRMRGRGARVPFLRPRERAMVGDQGRAGPRALVALGLVGVMAAVVVSFAVQGQPVAVRLALAVATGVVALNVLGMLLPAWLGTRVAGAAMGVRLSPALVAIALAVALATRLGGLEVPVILGAAVTTVVLGAPVVRARIAAAQLLSIATLAMIGWVSAGRAGSLPGLWATFTAEALTTLAFAGAGALLVLVVPVGGLPGRQLADRSLGAWLVVSLLVLTPAAFVLLGDADLPLGWVLGVLGAFGAAGFAAWAWLRFVEPAQRAH